MSHDLGGFEGTGLISPPCPSAPQHRHQHTALRSGVSSTPSKAPCPSPHPEQRNPLFLRGSACMQEPRSSSQDQPPQAAPLSGEAPRFGTVSPRPAPMPSPPLRTPISETDWKNPRVIQGPWWTDRQADRLVYGAQVHPQGTPQGPSRLRAQVRSLVRGAGMRRSRFCRWDRVIGPCRGSFGSSPVKSGRGEVAPESRGSRGPEFGPGSGACCREKPSLWFQAASRIPEKPRVPGGGRAHPAQPHPYLLRGLIGSGRSGCFGGSRAPAGPGRVRTCRWGGPRETKRVKEGPAAGLDQGELRGEQD